MKTFLYRCPNTSQMVQGHTDVPLQNEAEYQPVQCIACQRIHLVNPTTGEVAAAGKRR